MDSPPLTKNDLLFIQLVQHIEEDKAPYQAAIEPFSMALSLLALDIVNKSLSPDADREQAFSDILSILSLGFTIGYTIRME